MSSFPCIHHIEVGVVHGAAAVDILTKQYAFVLVATRRCAVADQWLVVRHNIRFLITNLTSTHAAAVEEDDFVIDWCKSKTQAAEKLLPYKDTVFNIAFQVKCFDSCLQRLQNLGVEFSKSPRLVCDSWGSLKTCAVKSCVGDIHHTLLDKNTYSGHFLPGFTTISCEEEKRDSSLDSLVTDLDHVALAVEMNTALAIIQWYEQCFGMKRFFINRDEEEDSGLVLSTNNVGLRLRAIEYWKCAEVGLLASQEDGIPSRLAIVLAEGLPPTPESTEENQVESWMRHHGGPGIQHVALTSSNIKTAVQTLRKLGAVFANPPPDAYYTQFGRLKDIERMGEDVTILQSNGILIDTEADGIHDVMKGPQNGHNQEKFLLQIFTKPVFKDPFFLEIIERKGATGFGSGNIVALYRSVQAYIVGQRKDEEN